MSRVNHERERGWRRVAESCGNVIDTAREGELISSLTHSSLAQTKARYKLIMLVLIAPVN